MMKFFIGSMLIKNQLKGDLKMFKKIQKVQKDLHSRIVHNRRCVGRYVVEIIGPPSSGKTLLLVGIQKKFIDSVDDEVEDQSDFLTEQAERVEPLRTPNQPVHSKPHLANEWLVTSKDHVFLCHPGEAIWQKSTSPNKEDNKGYDFESLKRRLKRGNQLGIFVINPFRLEKFAKIALLRLIHRMSTAAPDASGYRRVQIAAELAFGVYNPKSDSKGVGNENIDTVLLDHYRGSPGLQPEQRLEEIKNIFNNTEVNVSEGNKGLKLRNGCNPAIANQLLDSLVNQCVNEDRSFITRVMSISKKLSIDDAIIVFTYRDILREKEDGTNEMQINLDEFRTAFQAFGNQHTTNFIFVSVISYAVNAMGDIYPVIESNHDVINKVWDLIHSLKKKWEKKLSHFFTKRRRIGW